MKQNREEDPLKHRQKSSQLLRAVAESDVGAITRIYNHYIEHSTATFDEECLSEESTAQKIDRITERYPWLVFQADGQVVGYAHAGPFRGRSAYRFTTEATIYLIPESQGKGYGHLLYASLFEALRQRSYHSVMAAITIPNDASVRFHQRHGFRKVAHLSQVGYKFGRWLDVGYWQKMLSE